MAVAPDDRSRRAGLGYGVLAYALWGVIPLYWRLLHGVDPIEILAHRAAWGALTFVAIAAVAGQLGAVAAALRRPRVALTLVASAALLAANWGVFIYAVATGQVLDASLGYFINPLVSVLLGMIVLGERLRRAEWIAIAMAAIGVTIHVIGAGGVPWISLALAATFGAYGLVRKLARVDALAGSTAETLIMAPIGAAYLVLLAARGAGHLGHADADTQLLLLATGAVTAVPLICFTAAARRLPLSSIGFLQFLAPTGQFLTAVLVFGEPLTGRALVAFACIWAGLIAFAVGLVRRR